MKSCILWPGPIGSHGYGVVSLDGIQAMAHRLAFTLANPKIKIGRLWVLHRCDVRRCINPKHLFLGTARDNNLDMIRKGRQNHWKPEDAPCGRLSWEQVRAIRKNFRPRKHGQPGNRTLLAQEHGVSAQTINDIVKGVYWKEDIR